MAQSSAALREPTMDEILTSIREIIEENTAQANHYEAMQKRQNEMSVNANHIADKGFAPQDQKQSVQQYEQPALSESPALSKSNAQQFQQKQPEQARQQSQPIQSSMHQNQMQPQARQTLSVDDAMKALAARIGLVEELKVEANALEAKLESDVQLDEIQVAEGVPSSHQFQEEVEPNFYPQSAQIQNEADLDRQDIDSSDAKTNSYVKIDQAAPSTIDQQRLQLFSNAESLAENAIRPVLAQWLENQVPLIVERILREEISKVISNLKL